MTSSEQPGDVDGRYFTEYVETVKQLERDGRLDDAVALLLRLVDATEAEDAVERGGVAPWYYLRLAIIYRKQGDLDGERAILTRFTNQRHAPGVTPAKLLKRLEGLESRGLGDAVTEYRSSPPIAGREDHMAHHPDHNEAKTSIPPNEYRIYKPEDGPEWESMQVLEDDYWDRKDRQLQDSGECPYGHRHGVIPTPADLPDRREGHGDWWCTEHQIQFGQSKFK